VLFLPNELNSDIINYMAKRKNEDLELPNKIEAKIETRDKKRKPKMKVSGKSVFQIKKILTKN
jgi:hypothetical protein